MRADRAVIWGGLAVTLALASAPAAVNAKTFKVQSGESIQAAVDGASAGDTILVYPGDYTEPVGGPAAVRITKPLKLIAKSLPTSKVTIHPNTGQNHGILVEPENGTDPDIDKLTIQGFTIVGFPNMGIYLRHVNHFKIQGNESINNQENGIFPTLSANGLVKKNVAYGSTDAALWVEGSQNVRVLKNELATSPTGLEVTISNNVTIQKNNIHDNTIGIGLYHPTTAGLPEADWPDFSADGGYGYWHVLSNDIHDNNSANTASEGSETAQLPYGGGILVLGAQNVDIQKNRIERNNFFGIAMVDYCAVTLGTPFQCDISPPSMVAPTYPKYVQNIKNALVDNHAFPPAGPFESYAADIVDLGAQQVCYYKNSIVNAPGLPVPNPDPATLGPSCF